ncbi:MAG: hypothetical protein V1712_04055 [Patescibacteria group bacterium]
MSPFAQENQISWFEKLLIQHYKWLAGLLALIIVGGGVWWLVKPMYLEWRTMTRAQDLQKVLVDIQAQVAALDSKVATWNKIKNQSDTDLHLILPSNIDVPDLLTQMDDLINKHKYVLSTITVSESGTTDKKANAKSTAVADTDGVRTVKITLSLAGSGYENFKSLLQALQSAWRLLNVNSFNYAEEVDSYSIELTSYYYPR